MGPCCPGSTSSSASSRRPRDWPWCAAAQARPARPRRSLPLQRPLARLPRRRGRSCCPRPPAGARILLPGGGVLRGLPGQGDLMSLTLDDGVDTAVVRGYCQLAKDTGIRLTMFVTGVFSSWTDNRDLLMPLVESGQIQLGNHTWIHPDLTKLSPLKVADELRHTDQFIRD